MTQISVIIVSYNTKTLPSADERTMLKNKYPEVLVVENNENIGFGRANNEAAKVAKGEYLLLLNSDTLLMNDALYHFFEEVKDVDNTFGCMGAFLYGEDRELCHSYGVFPSIGKEIIHLFYPIYKHFRKNTNTFVKDVEYEVDYVTGAALFIKRSLFHEYKGFDSDFFMYFEETDLQYRLRNAGFKVFISNKPKIIHLEGQSNNCSNNKRIMFDKSLLLYLKKNNNSCKFFLYKFLKFFIFIFSCSFNQYKFTENWEYLKKVIL